MTHRSQHSVAVAVLVSGSGTLLQAILDHQDESYHVCLVAADSECPALERARRAGVRVAVVELGGDREEWDASLRDAVDSAAPDLVVSAGFMRIVGKAFLDTFEGRLINTHPALLPSFPGAHAVRDALAYGVKVTGTTVHYIDAGVDTGEIIAQAAVDVRPGETEAQLHERIKVRERALIVDVLRRAHIDNGKAYFTHG
ncbi:phosphoribosylglycinamide formyltransferase [Corynebacterium liangguodongii]|uniref:Phosphoribosylglycinamide formyltransferase n=1 Tax=Corynebacterium liangguodongii TaxID=2079535 RepID=A0A2S0WD17_9CORY|nr:phosphoribosylglycinamide formyltransferase [Corynebacterium liangguodongii]AWB83658.1 phosphoribosylglycinamide formyltransferase [Corynebacterium liangguodongii]PWB99533.1 phosphoribosylglycinamide formyltransferase [Corynebacterium liangguodongii]